MEENKIESGPTASEASHHHSGHHAEHHMHHEGHKGRHGMGCQGHHCGHMGYHIIKALIIIFVVILLLSIGAAMGSRRESRYNNFNHYGNGGCGYRTEVPVRGSADGRFYMMMGDTQGIPAQGAQFIEVRSTNGNVPTTVTIPAANATPAAGGTTTQTAPVN